MVFYFRKRRPTCNIHENNPPRSFQRIQYEPLQQRKRARCWHRSSLTPAWTLVVKEDAIAGKDVVGFAVVRHNPIGIQFSRTWGRSKVTCINLMANKFCVNPLHTTCTSNCTQILRDKCNLAMLSWRVLPQTRVLENNSAIRLHSDLE